MEFSRSRGTKSIMAFLGVFPSTVIPVEMSCSKAATASSFRFSKERPAFLTNVDMNRVLGLHFLKLWKGTDGIFHNFEIIDSFSMVTIFGINVIHCTECQAGSNIKGSRMKKTYAPSPWTPSAATAALFSCKNLLKLERM
jgi:hypothetical protein